MTAFVFSIREHPTVLSFAGWAYKAVWPTFFRKIFVAGFLATELGYERRKSQFVFEWNNVIPPFSRFLITFYHFNSLIVRPLSDLTQRDNHIFFLRCISAVGGCTFVQFQLQVHAMCYRAAV